MGVAVERAAAESDSVTPGRDETRLSAATRGSVGAAVGERRPAARSGAARQWPDGAARRRSVDAATRGAVGVGVEERRPAARWGAAVRGAGGWVTARWRVLRRRAPAGAVPSCA